jgi:transposase InsO family protein
MLYQDNGLEFTGDVFVEVYIILGIDRTTTTPYSPQSNSQVERVNQMPQNMLKCICLDTGRDWADVAQWTVSAYRARQQESTGQSPNKLMCGDEVAQPLDLVYGRDYNVVTCATEYVQWLQSNIAYVHAQAEKHLDAKLKAQKTYYDRKLRERSFEVGEKVL